MGEPAQAQSLAKLDDQLKLQILRNMVPQLKCYLVPTKIVPHLGAIIKESEEVEILGLEEAGKKAEAVQKLMDIVLRKKEEGLRYFLPALRKREGTPAWERFLEPLEGRTGINNENRSENEELAFIIRLIQGEIVEMLTEGELLAMILDLIADDVLSVTDEQMIRATLEQKGLLHAAVQLLPLMRQYTEDWPSKLLKTLKKQKDGFLQKFDPLAEDPVTESRETAQAEGVNDATSDVRDGRREKNVTKQTEQTLPKTVVESMEVPEQARSMDRFERESDESMDDGSSKRDHCEETSDDTSSDIESICRRASFSDDEKADNESSEKHSGKSHEQHEPKDLCLRKYQEELAALAVEGKNTIICAPTGSGKTRVALHIVLQHLMRAAGEGEKRKVVFLARTVPLVQQQFKNFEEYLPDTINSVMVTGESMHSGNLHMLVPDYDVLVLTPKILENHLTRDKIRSLGVFSLIIFDECHHTRKGEPYNSVMKNYLKSKQKGEKLPQIVGLTASIGVEKAATAVEARKSILKIMGNLDVTCISRVQKHWEELERKVPRPAEPDAQELRQRQDEISRSIKDIIRKIEELQDEICAKMADPKAGKREIDAEVEEIRRTLSKRPEDPKEQKYGQWAVNLRKQVLLLKFPSSEPQTRQKAEQMEKQKVFCREMQVLANWLVAYSEALDVHDLSCPKDVLHYLKQKFEIQLACKRKNADFTPVEENLFGFFQGLERKLQKATEGNPNLEILANTIRAHLEEDEDSRILVFVRTRATCTAVCRWLNSHEELQRLHAMTFTGTGAHQDRGGMTLNEQEAVLEKFRNGDVSLLVSTSVGEEGIDIAECNLTIKYNHVGNEVTTVQTRGRSRKEGGKSILLAMPKIIMQERINRRREQYMLDAIKYICGMPEKDILDCVKKVQKETLEDDAIDNIVRKTKKCLLKKENFMLVCARCRGLRVDGSQIRTIDDAHRVIIGHDIDDKVQTHPVEKPKRLGQVELRGTVICKNCKNHLGQWLYYKKNQFISVGLKSWVLLDKDNIPSSCKRWKEVHYSIDAISEDDIKEHVKVSSREGDQVEEDLEGAVGGADL